MQDDNLPSRPEGDGRGDQLPVQRPGQLAVGGGQRALALDVFEDKRGGDEDEIDLLAYWRILVKRKWLVLGVLGTVVALALIATLMMPPVYRATATLQIDRESVQILQVEGVGNAEAAAPDFLTTQYELLKSRALAERVANELAIDANTVERLESTTWWQRATSALRPQPANAASAGAEAEAAESDAMADLGQAVGIVRSGLTVEPVRNSRLVRIHFDSTLPAFSARVVNAVADGFIAHAIERKFDASSYASKYIEEQLALAKGRLEESERALVAFATKENIVTSGEGSQSLESQNLGALNASLAAAQDERIRAQAAWSQVSGGGQLPAGAIGNSILNTLQQQRAELQGQYQQKLQVFKPDYPEMKQLEGQIALLSNQDAQIIDNGFYHIGILHADGLNLGNFRLLGKDREAALRVFSQRKNPLGQFINCCNGCRIELFKLRVERKEMRTFDIPVTTSQILVVNMIVRQQVVKIFNDRFQFLGFQADRLRIHDICFHFIFLIMSGQASAST